MSPLTIDGAVQVIPLSIATDVGELRAGEEGNTQTVVILSCLTENGNVQIIIPTDHVEGIIRALEKSKTDADAKASDLVVAGAADLSQLENIKKANDEVRGEQ